jgi:hypothetical protein
MTMRTWAIGLLLLTFNICALAASPQPALAQPVSKEIAAANGRAADAERRASEAERTTQIIEARDEIAARLSTAASSEQSVLIGILGCVVGLFGALITAIVVFFSFKIEKSAVAAATKEIGAEKKRIEDLLGQAEAAVGNIRVG